nr:hypothetical protein [Tanacetum cinerariifolium]
DAEIAKQLQEAIVKADSAHDIDWNDPVVLRYHALQNKSFSVAEDDSSSKSVGGSRKKTVAKKRIGAKLDEESTKRQKLEDVTEEEATTEKFPIVSWEYQSLEKMEAKDMKGDLRKIFDPDENDKLWMNQLDWKLLRCKFHENCRGHTLFMDGTPMEINMLVEKKYPLIKELLEKMLNL